MSILEESLAQGCEFCDIESSVPGTFFVFSNETENCQKGRRSVHLKTWLYQIEEKQTLSDCIQFMDPSVLLGTQGCFVVDVVKVMLSV